MAFSLHYYNGDYKPIGGASINPAYGIDYANTTLNTGVGNALNLYNGNIRFMQTTLTKIDDGTPMPMLNAYKYDQLNRLLEARSYTDGLSGNEWNPTTYDDKYFNKFTYDANGNILTQKRHNSSGTLLDDLTYNYLLNNGNLIRNRLYHVNDAVLGAPTQGDLEDQGTIINTSQEDFETLNNYKYDAEGRLIQDKAEGIEEIVWRVDGKVKKVIFEDIGAGSKNNLEFDYDAFGRRIAKHVRDQQELLVKSTYYVLDAQGNQLSTYEHIPEEEDDIYELAERVIYGSSRLGINVNKVDILDEDPEEILSLTLGNKLYEMSNHLGNVLTVINDIKVPQATNSVDVDGYLATIVSTADYSPFGVQLDGRTESAETYRYGFQGQEKDDEIKGAGNSVNYTYRMHDPRLGRFFAVDPLFKKYPHYSPYSFSGNKLIHARELEGLEEVILSDPNPEAVYNWQIDIRATPNSSTNPEVFEYFTPDLTEESYHNVVRKLPEPDCGRVLTDEQAQAIFDEFVQNVQYKAPEDTYPVYPEGTPAANHERTQPDEMITPNLPDINGAVCFNYNLKVVKIDSNPLMEGQPIVGQEDNAISESQGAVNAVDPHGTDPGFTYQMDVDIKIGTSEYYIQGTITVKIYEPDV